MQAINGFDRPIPIVSANRRRDEAHHLLWTGGWDSTFRLLELVLLKRELVQPYYIIDAERRSTRAELRAIQNVKTQLLRRDPLAAELLLPIRFVDVQDIPPHPAITESFQRIRRDRYLGSQYEWMSRFCAAAGIDYMEMGIRSAGPQGLLQPLAVIDTEHGHLARIGNHAKGSDIHTLFGCFLFPVFNVSKTEIEEIARREGFLDLMKLTWFCHDPRPDEKPCGICFPCVDAREEGMSWRLPFTSKLRYYVSGRALLIRKIVKTCKLYTLAMRIRETAR
jgi:hypothetical protein